MQYPGALRSYLAVTASLPQNSRVLTKTVCVCACVWEWGFTRKRSCGDQGGERHRGRNETCGREERRWSQKRKNIWFSEKVDLRKQINRDNHHWHLLFPASSPRPCKALAHGCRKNIEVLILWLHEKPPPPSSTTTSLWISPVCPQDTKYQCGLAFQASHLKWCIRNVTSL